MIRNTTNGGRAFVLGLDGIPWDLLHEWSQSGVLPNFARLFEEGAAGPLESTAPATTALAWPSIATGVWPDKHGLYGFRRLGADHNHRMNTSRDVRQPELWDVLGPSVVGNVPMTYPASEIDGRMVTGMMTPSLDGKFAHPHDLAVAVDERLPDYRIGLDWNEYVGREADLISDLTNLVADRRELMRLLMETPDWRLFFFVYTAPDRLQHLVWDTETILEHYRLLDDVLGEVLSYVTERDANLYVVSDHGFGPIERLVFVNTLLEREGYLSRRVHQGTRGAFATLGLTKDRVHRLLDRLGIEEETLLRYLPADFVEQAATRIPGKHTLFDVDFRQTRAFFYGDGLLYINDAERFDDGPVAPVDIPQIKTEIAELLEGLVDPVTGEQALDIRDGDEVFSSDNTSPDLVVTGHDDYMAETSLADEVFSDAGHVAASHRSEGIFLAWGPDVRAGSTPEAATVVDVAPTVLHAMGEPVPEAGDGRVLNELFIPGSPPAIRGVRSRRYAADREDTVVNDEFESVERRLRGLGYLE